MMRTSGIVIAVLGVTLALAAATWTSRAQKADERVHTAQVTFKVEGMTCAGCEAGVKLAAKAINGVHDAQASFKSGTADITYDPTKTTPDAIAEVITERSGFKAVAQGPSKK
jgi:copper chaperone CopZ